MDEKNEVDNELMLPGFRFHPTDEELISFYLKRKIQQRPLSIELIKQLDIYKYDPWDLPREKEWYFYCPRDRKYRNSARPNRVTGAGFWKATGTDRPIYSSEGTNCIGLKKSLVYYKGRAAKGIKTDWMMHEFRLPSITDSTPSKRPLEKNPPTNDSWAICRIFKKTCSMAQRTLAHSWVSPISENTGLDPYSHTEHGTQFVTEDISCTSEAGSAIMFSCHNALQKSTTNFPCIDIPLHKAINPTTCKPPLFPISDLEFPSSFIFSPPEMIRQTKCTVNHPSMPQNLSPSTSGDVSRASMNIDFGLQQCNSYAVNLQQEIKGNVDDEKEACLRRNHEHNQLEITTTVNVPFNLPPILSDEWKSNFPWDSPPCPSEISVTYSTANCYT